MKKIVFLIIASLLMIGLVLPGCGGGGGGAAPIVYDFEDGKVVIGICTDIGTTTGDMEFAGAVLAIYAMGGINISGVAHNLTYVKIDTDEATDTTGVTGANALQAAISADSFDFLMGGFRAAAMANYRKVAMNAHRIFFDCGSLTNALQQDVVTNYTGYKYWFKFTPYTEDFLADALLRLIDSVAGELRTAKGWAPATPLRAVIIAEDLPWAIATAGIITPGLPALNIALNFTYIVDAYSVAPTGAALQDAILDKGYDPHIIIPLYSRAMGVAYAGYLMGYLAANVTDAMSVGINVYAQLKAPWTATNFTSPPPGGPYCKNEIILDTWADGLVQTSKTAAFFAAFTAMIGGEYPMYSAATYDACYALKACLEETATYNSTTGVATVKADDIIAWFENPANAQVTTTGLTTYYPRPGTTAAGQPALTEAQVRSLYDIDSYGYTYNISDWLMPPHTSHDLAYGPGLATTIGAQWQWVGNETVGQWKKVGVWPQVETGIDLTDQYGDWNFAYPGTQNITIPWFVLDGHT